MVPEHFSFAAGMLAGDWLWALLGLLLVPLPNLVAQATGEYPLSGFDPDLLATHVLGWSFLALTTWRWLVKLSSTPKAKASLVGCLWIVVFGTLFSTAFTLSPVIDFPGSKTVLNPIGLLIVTILFVAGLRFAFLFITAFFPFSFHERVSLARSYTQVDSLLTLKILLGPATVALLTSVLIGAFSPDGRHAAAEFAGSFIVPLFWVMGTYTLVATALHRLPDSAWHALKLDPYRQARMSTVIISAPKIVTTLLSTRKLGTLLLIVALIWGGNFLRLASLPPAPTLAVNKTEIEGNRVRLLITAHDPHYHMRGFWPIFFALAGENRALIASSPRLARIEGEIADIRFGAPRAENLSFILEFEANRPASSLAQLEDLYLWYRNARLVRLDLGNSVRKE